MLHDLGSACTRRPPTAALLLERCRRVHIALPVIVTTAASMVRYHRHPERRRLLVLYHSLWGLALLPYRIQCAAPYPNGDNRCTSCHAADPIATQWTATGSLMADIKAVKMKMSIRTGPRRFWYLRIPYPSFPTFTWDTNACNIDDKWYECVGVRR